MFLNGLHFWKGQRVTTDRIPCLPSVICITFKLSIVDFVSSTYKVVSGIARTISWSTVVVIVIDQAVRAAVCWGCAKLIVISQQLWTDGSEARFPERYVELARSLNVEGVSVFYVSFIYRVIWPPLRLFVLCLAGWVHSLYFSIVFQYPSWKSC